MMDINSIGEKLRGEYEDKANFTQEESEEFIHKIAREYYNCGEGEATVHTHTLNGFEIGMVHCYSELEDGTIPTIVKNLRVEAARSFERATRTHSDTILPSEFYVGYLEGFQFFYGM